jgi:hypothetical protein
MRIKPKIEKLGWFFKVQLVARWGVPDVIGVINGRFVALELKASKKGHGGAGEKLQDYVLSKIEKHGGYARKVYPENWDEVYKELHSLSKPQASS